MAGGSVTVGPGVGLDDGTGRPCGDGDATPGPGTGPATAGLGGRWAGDPGLVPGAGGPSGVAASDDGIPAHADLDASGQGRALRDRDGQAERSPAAGDQAARAGARRRQARGGEAEAESGERGTTLRARRARLDPAERHPARAVADVGGRQARPPYERAVEPRRRLSRVEGGQGARSPDAVEGQDVVVEIGGAAPDPVDGSLAAEERREVGARIAERVRQHRAGPGPQPAGAVVVDPLPGHIERSLGQARLRVAAGVAQVVEDHDRPGGEADLLRDEQFAEVLVGVVARAGDRVEPEPVLRRREQGVPVRRRPAVAVTEVEDDRRTAQGPLDRRPGGVRRDDRDDVSGPAPGFPGRRGPDRAVQVGQPLDRPDDDRDARFGACADDGPAEGPGESDTDEDPEDPAHGTGTSTDEHGGARILGPGGHRWINRAPNAVPPGTVSER